MPRTFPVATLAIVLMACAEPVPPPAETVADAPPAPPDRITIAMSAAPAAIAAAATIMDFDASGTLVELRAGTNGWMCLPDDNPAAPGDAPMCLDETWQQWMGAYMARETPRISRVGVSYMLQGGLAASNSDPFAMTPPEGADWISDGPHIMILVPNPAQLAGMPTDPASGGPYVMWQGTPYAHIMIPSGGSASRP